MVKTRKEKHRQVESTMSVTATMLHKVRLLKSLQLIALILALYILGDPVFAQVRTEAGIPRLNYEAVPNFFQLPAGQNLVECCGVAVNSKGYVYVFHRGKHPLLEFDSSGKYVRSIAD